MTVSLSTDLKGCSDYRIDIRDGDSKSDKYMSLMGRTLQRNDPIILYRLNASHNTAVATRMYVNWR